MKRLAALLLACSMLLCGCAALTQGSYNNIKPHEAPNTQNGDENPTATDFESLCAALAGLVAQGRETGVVIVEDYEKNLTDTDLRKAARQVMENDPVTAYAVEELQCQLGTSGTQAAVAVEIRYVHDRTEILKIRKVANLETAISVIGKELDACGTGVVLYLNDYQGTDFAQIVEDYALSHPQTVMELPRVQENVYPETGDARVVELKFTYQNSRGDLRAMQIQVNPVFESAVLYVSGDAKPMEKYAQLYSFLMERYDYTIQTSITPSYSLLRHGVGDVHAFAMVYAAMCVQAGLECDVITGTRHGQAWYWNRVCDGGVYYHVDLLRCSENGKFKAANDSQMTDYVWDYSAYPATAE